MQDVTISEKKLEDFIYGHLTGEQIVPGVDDYFSGGLSSAVWRQPNFGDYGRPDIVTFDIEPFGCGFTIYELKQGEINTQTLMQALHYKRGLQNILFDSDFLAASRSDINCVLIGAYLSEANYFETGLSALAFSGIVNVYLYDIDPTIGLTLKDDKTWIDDWSETPASLLPKITECDYCLADFNAYYYNTHGGQIKNGLCRIGNYS